jgi:hypothetical protein
VFRIPQAPRLLRQGFSANLPLLGKPAAKIRCQDRQVLFRHKNLREDPMYFSGKIEYYKVTPRPRPLFKVEILKNIK